MVRMIPPTPREGANGSEKRLFTALEGMVDHDDWIVIHSMRVARHATAFAGEADFVVIAPGRGIAIIEAKAQRSVRYENGDWFLESTPQPSNDPLLQLDGVRRGLRGYLKELGILQNTEPIVRLVWFTSIGRHQFENATPGDLQFFEWELAWRDDLAKPARMLEHVFTEHDKWYRTVEGVDHDPLAFTAERAEEIQHALLGNFHVSESVADRLRERQLAESALLAEQELVLEIVDRSPHVYLDGPAGTGKSHLFAKAARQANRKGKRTLVTCWNLLMAEELAREVGLLPHVDVISLGQLMRELAGLETDPDGADHEWYTRTLPGLALAALQKTPGLRAYEVILVDEFQDIAGNQSIAAVLGALGADFAGARLLLAGDTRQQILRPSAERVDAFAAAKAWIPDLVHVRVARNCRNVPAITQGAQEPMPRERLGFTGHRMPKGVPGGLSVRSAAEGETAALANALRELLQEFPAENIVVLSPFAANRSLVGRFLARTDSTRAERWLRKQLEHPGGGKISWRSVFKFKGLDADAVVLTDIGDASRAFAAEQDLAFTDLVYVAITRAKNRCIVLTSD